MDYEVYHDESQVGGYWHGILLVPSTSRQRLLDLLGAARSTTNYSHPLSIKSVKNLGRVFDCSKAWLTIAVAAMVSKSSSRPVPVYFGKSARRGSEYGLVSDHLSVKFVLFCERDKLQKMTGYPDHGSKVETTLRMGLKGGMHFLGSHDNPIAVERIHLDGHAHYHRRVSKSRLSDRLVGLREYCSVSGRPDLIDDGPSDHRKPDSQPHDDCQLLQLTDLLVGAFRIGIRGTTKDLHRRLAFPVGSLLQRYAQGESRMANSRWNNSFTMSQCYLDQGKWRFQPLECVPDVNYGQLTLPTP